MSFLIPLFFIATIALFLVVRSLKKPGSHEPQLHSSGVNTLFHKGEDDA